ncbi:MAG: site-2 protease family protein [Clostridia bacterium]|nr:site-2 protease family protein [Clostridia bacterium]
MTTVWTVLAAVLIFCVMIFVHELGHFLSAKLLGIRVHEFAIGMGPKLFGKTKGETLYSVRALPIGGFCALEGEDEDSEDEKALSNKPAWVKLIVLASGAVMNFLLGFLLLLFIFGSEKEFVVPRVETVVAESPAEIAGLMPGDEIIRYNGENIQMLWDLNKAVYDAGTAPAELTVRRGDEKLSLTVTARPQKDKYVIGIGLAKEPNSVFMTLKSSFYGVGFYTGVILETVVGLLRGEVPVQNLSGPVGIVSEIGSAVQTTTEKGWQGFLSLLNLAVLLTVNLGVFNLLPLPALDGGRIFFVLVSLVIRKKIPPEKEGLVHFIGFVLLILLSIFVAYSDVLRLFG